MSGEQPYGIRGKRYHRRGKPAIQIPLAADLTGLRSMSPILVSFVGPILAALLLTSTVQANGSSSHSDATHPQPNSAQIEGNATPTKGDPQLQHKGRLGKNIKDNAAAITTIAAAITTVATIVAAIFIALNYRLTVRNQQDTQFYEALKRFGDNDSPSVRFSAAGLLSVMACRHKRYFATAFFQLNAGQSFEENSVVSEQLSENLADLYRHNPFWCLGVLFDRNDHLRQSFLRALASLCILRGANVAEPISDEFFREAESLSIYSRFFRHTLNKAVEDAFLQNAVELAALPQQEREKRMSREARDLADYTKRLTANIGQINTAARVFDRVYGRMACRIFKTKGELHIEGCFLPTAAFSSFGFNTQLNFRSSELQFANFEWTKSDKSTFESCRLDSANFRNANLRGAGFVRVSLDGADLKWANLSEAKLVGCSLRGADLTNTKLDGAELRSVDVLNAKFDWLNRDVLRKCKWWESKPGEPALRDLYDQYQMNPKAFTYQLPEDFSIDKRILEERGGAALAKGAV